MSYEEIVHPLPLDAQETLCRLARLLGERGWLPATSGNLSLRLAAAPLQFVVTRSGADKQQLTSADLVVVDAKGQLMQPHALGYRPSAEATVHGLLYETTQCGCVLHVHTLYNNLCSDLYYDVGAMPISGHELLKALGHWQLDAAIRVPIVDNYHDLSHLARAVADAAQTAVPGVLVRNHGIYVWGDTPETAYRHLEAFEFLFAYDALRRSVRA